MSTNTKAMIISVGTGQEGKDVAHAICFSIRQQNPDLIIFLSTSVSKTTTMPFILENNAVKEKDLREVELNDPDDIERITMECQEVIRSVAKEGCEKRNIVVDYTSGTKAMSSGLSIAAIREGVGTLTYTTGKRGEGGRVISGTERVLAIVPNQIFVEDLFKEAVDSFNTYHFDVSIRVLEDAKALISDPEFHKKAQTLGLLSRAYSSWDRFEISEAFEILKQFRQNPLLREWGIDNRVESNKQALYREKENLFCSERVFDLLENAKRRGDDEHKYDDAMARLYRLAEYLGQFRLNRLGLYKVKDGKPDASDLEIAKLPSHLQASYSKYTDAYDGKVKLHLSANYSLLYDLNDPIGLFFKERRREFKKLLGLRDLSILAHGFNPVSEETYKDMLRFVEELINSNGLGDIEVGENVRFPKIKLQQI